MSDSKPSPRFRGLQNVLDNLFAGVAVWCSRHAWLVLGAAAVLLVVGFYGASKVQMDNSLDSYFDEKDPAYSFYKNYIQEFSSDEVIYLLYSVPGKEHGPFDLEAMKKIDSLTRAIEAEVPFVRKVTSLSNVEFIKADGDLIEIEALMEKFPESQDELLKLRELALSKPLYVGSVISKDASHAAVVVEMSRTSTDPIEKLRLDPNGGDDLPNLYPQAPDTKMREILARPEYQGIDFKISGDVPMNSAYNILLGQDLGNLTMITFVLVAIMSVLFLGVRPTNLFAPLIVTFLSLLLTLGLMGFVGWKANLFFMMIPTLLCAMGVAQAVHMLIAWQNQRAIETDRTEAVRKTIIKIGVPCLMVSVTDAFGFLGTGISNLRSLAEMAWYASFGVLMTFVLSITLLIAFAARSKPMAAAQKPPVVVRWLKAQMPKVVAFDIKHSKAILVVFALILVGAGIGVQKLRVDFNFLVEFKPKVEWRQHTEYVNEHMGGVLSVVYLFDTQSPDGIKSVELLREIEGLQEVAKSMDVVQYTVSVVDIVKEMNQAFHGGDPAYYKIPEDREMLAQLLLVYELSGGKEMNDVLNLDRSETALQVRLKLVGASEVRKFTEAMDAYLAKHPMANAKVEISGIGLLWVKMADYISITQVEAYAITFALICFAMIVAFGSVRLGLLAMIPNLFPIVLTLGFMGWFDWHLDYFRLLLATIAIGIAVDDTIHFVSCYKREFEDCGRYKEALERTLPEVGPAMIAMTAILVVSFSAYYASSLAIVASFGFLLSLTIGAAAISDLLLMPTLLLWLKPFGPERPRAPASEAAATTAPLEFDQGVSR